MGSGKVQESVGRRVRKADHSEQSVPLFDWRVLSRQGGNVVHSDGVLQIELFLLGVAGWHVGEINRCQGRGKRGEAE